MEGSNGTKSVAFTITYIPCPRCDINEDGAEDDYDISFIISIDSGKELNATASQLEKADLNNDGVVDAFDAALLDTYTCSF